MTGGGATIKIGRGRGGHITTESVQKQKQEIPKKEKKSSIRSARAHQARLILQRALQLGILQLAFVLPEESSSQFGVALSCLACLLVEFQRNERR